MKITVIGVFFACCAFHLSSCRQNAQSDIQDHDVLPLSEDSEGSSTEETDRYLAELRRHYDRELFYVDYFSISRVLGVPDDITVSEVAEPVITDAFILSVEDDGQVQAIERICGRVPSDFKDYLPMDAAPGNYLAGRLMPDGGWTLGGIRDSGVFFLRDAI